MFRITIHFRRGLPRLGVVAAAWCIQTAVVLAADPAPRDVKQIDAFAWPSVTTTAKPWTYWYWMGGAVEERELSRHLELYQQAGLGGVHLVPVYGVRGAELKYVPFLSPRWMELLAYTVGEANRLGIGVDMTTGTGWPFGGPWVHPPDAAAHFALEEFAPNESLRVEEPIRARDKEFASASLVVLMASGPNGDSVELTNQVDSAGQLDWQAPQSGWRLTAMFQSPTNVLVERAAPGGEGPTIDYFDRESLNHYLKTFDEAFGNFMDLRVRCMYSDSYENWGENWTPKLLDEFQRRRGYDLRAHLRQLETSDTTEKALRVRADFRETMADLIRDEFVGPWANWALSKFEQGTDPKDRSANAGRLIVGDNLEQLLDRAGVSREPMVDAGLKFIRRRDAAGKFYFIVNHSGKRLEQWIPVTSPAREIVFFDPASGQSGKAAARRNADTTECFVQLNPRQSLIVRTLQDPADGPNWDYLRERESQELAGPWHVEFIDGGPTLPESVTVKELSDWTQWHENNLALQSFSGIARYVTEFELPELTADRWKLDLGSVCHSASVRLNGEMVGTLITAPFEVDVTRALRKGLNRLEVDVANLPANRVANLDRRGVDWQKFLFVDIKYQPFDASKWATVPSGLLGPVKLSAQRHLKPDELLSFGR